MRIAVMNLQFGVGTTRGYWHYTTTAWKYFLPHSLQQVEQAARECVSESVDIAIVTEISTSQLRSPMSQVEAFRNAFGAKYVHFFASAASRLWNEGNAIFTHYEIIETQTHKLPGGIVPRILGEVSIKIENRIITIFVAHLALGKKVRDKQLQKILAIVSNKKGPVIVGGDFNERDASRLNRSLGDTFVNTCELPTFPSWQPKHALQHLFLNGRFVLEKEYIPDSSAFSDHSALLAEASFNVA